VGQFFVLLFVTPLRDDNLERKQKQKQKQKQEQEQEQIQGFFAALRMTT
jgi:uncharacterized membrane protein